jgi:DNA-binding transcriptional LysR family regulator
MSELDDIRAFVEVADSGGFARAARRLGLSKSIVSRRVTRLETELGARLLARTTRGISPTEAGLEFQARGKRILAELDAAREAVAHGGEAAVGQLRISAPVSFVEHLSPVLAELAARHPKLSVDAAYADRYVDLVSERFDAAVRIGTLEDSSLIARRLAPIRKGLLASPAYLDRRGRPRTPADLNDHDALLYTGAREVESWRFRSGKRWVAVTPAARFRADNGEALLQAAAAGLGIAAVPTFLMAPWLESGRLEPVLRDHPMPEGGLYLVRPPGPVPGKVRALTDILVERFGGEPYWDACQMRECAPAAENAA